MNNETQQELKGSNSLSELFFFYNPNEHKVIYINQPASNFFNLPVSIAEQISFPDYNNEQEKDGIQMVWRQSLELQPNDSNYFKIQRSTSDGRYNFHFTASCSEIDNIGRIVIFHVKKESVENSNDAKLQSEINEFVDLASHDLDAPLRKLAVLVDTLQLKASKPGEDLTPYVSRINRCIGDMRSLVDSLANLSRVNNEKKNFQEFELGALLLEVLEEMDEGIREKKATVSVTELPVVMADRKQFHILFKNLLENALLFSRNPPLIDISSTKLSDEEKKSLGLSTDRDYNKIRISDNGIGIMPEDTEKIFSPFVRLNGKSEFAGNGIGLAICKKIVNNHQGILYAEKKEDEGARFILIIPQTIIDAN